MIRNYFKTSFRYLLNNPITTVISIAGLAVGVCCFLLLTTYLLNELRYDRFHKNAESIVRVDFNYKSASDAEARSMPITPTAVAPVFKKELAEVADGVRIYDYTSYKPAAVQYKDRLFNEKNVLLADESFFRMFSFNFLAGNAASALTNPGSIVITASSAKKYFGNEDPMGKVIRMNDQYNMIVTGVIQDVLPYSQIKFDMMGTYSLLPRSKTQKWDSGNEYTYLLLQPGANVRGVEQKMNAYLADIKKDDIKAGNKTWFTLEPLTRIHLYSKLSNGLGTPGNIKYVYILGVVAVILLLLACINFLNLVTAKSADRAHEIGVRKVMGAMKKQLFAQFITEAGLITFASVGIGLVLTFICFPWFSNFTGQALSFQTWRLGWLVGALIMLFTAITFLAGTYPALFLSAFNPVRTLKGKASQSPGGGGLRKSLVIFQFVVSVFFIICTVIAGNQLQYIQHLNTGINRSQVAVIDIGGMPYSNIEAFKNAILQQQGVQSVSASYDSPLNVKGGYTLSGTNNKIGSFNLSVTAIPVEKSFASTLGVQLIAGSDFTLTDEKQVLIADNKLRKYGFILNETAVKALGLTPAEAIGQRISMNGREGEIKAVARDFNFASLHQAITPIAIFTEYDWFAKLLIKTSGNNVAHTVSGIKNSWRAFYPNLPFECHFLDQEFDDMYKNELVIGGILNVFTAITIFISCLGLFGLAVYNTRQRVKELSIRKVLGASVSSIVALVSFDFLKLVIAAIVIAIPLAWYLMEKWLQDFAFRVQIQWWVFVLSGAAAILIAFLTVSFQSIKAALANPVKSLRSE